MDDQVIRGTVVAHQGAVTWPPPQIVNPSPVGSSASAAKAEIKHEKATYPKWLQQAWAGAGIAVLLGLLGLIGIYAPPDFVGHFTVFVLSCFIGWQVVWNVTPALHTPLMSVTNAISGIIVVGGIMQVGSFGTWGGAFHSWSTRCFDRDDQYRWWLSRYPANAGNVSQARLVHEFASADSLAGRRDLLHFFAWWAQSSRDIATG
jgi:hypothetical protein